MAAKRLGSCLTNIQGTAGQLLRVKTDESGFEFVTPATIPAYTVTNKTVDRALDANDTTLDELADVVGTLIDDLTAIGSPGAVQSVYVSGTYSHTGSNTPETFTITHNLGSEPDYVACQVLDNNNLWVNMGDMYISGSQVYGAMALTDNNASANVTSFMVYQYQYYGLNTRTIRFICAKLGQVAQVAPFQWSSSEQVWPFEKDRNGNTLYCKEVDCGTLPNNGYGYTNHNISNLDVLKVHSCTGKAVLSGSSYTFLPYAYPSSTADPIGLWCNATQIVIKTGTNWGAFQAMARMIYAK
jgi:hypothetical protein